MMKRMNKMYNDELFQKIASNPGITVEELAEYFEQPKGSIYRKLNRLEKYDVLYTRQIPSPCPRGKSTVKAYYPQETALKYKR